jgi:hypothetical protein
VHPNLIAALVDDRRMFCPCGVVPSEPYQLCRSCFARISRPSRSLDRHQVNWCARARTLAAAASALRVVGKGSRS